MLDNLLGRVRRGAVLSDYPEPPRGEDNLARPMPEVPPVSSGGWRTAQYKSLEMVSRVALGIGALVIIRRLAKR